MLEFALEIMPVICHIGVVFSFMGSLSLDRCYFYFLMISKEMVTFLSLSNPVLGYITYDLITTMTMRHAGIHIGSCHLVTCSSNCVPSLLSLQAYHN